MCLVIDTCVFHLVFSDDSDFSPIYNWITQRNGKIIIGGSEYNRQLRNARKYLGVFLELERIGKLVRIDSDRVDDAEEYVKSVSDNPDFDDAHLIALVDESGCKLLCSNDRRADKFITNKRFYRKSSPPKIYRYRSHQKLLKSNNIVSVCR